MKGSSALLWGRVGCRARRTDHIAEQSLSLREPHRAAQGPLRIPVHQAIPAVLLCRGKEDPFWGQLLSDSGRDEA